LALNEIDPKNPPDNSDPIVIVGSARTPIGDLLGVFSGVPAPIIGATAIKAAVERAQLLPQDINEVMMGCVLPAGQGQAPARQASLYAGLPNSVPCSTLNKMCGSGMKAVMLAHDLLLTGNNKIMVAGGMESMSSAPYLLDKARAGYRLGHNKIFDHLMLDGLEDAYEKGLSMGVFAERTSEKYSFTRAEQDSFATTSLKRAQEATEKGWFLSEVEITPISVKPQKGESFLVQEDEHPKNVKTEKIPTLKPVFKENGTITAANSSAISDGAAALVLMRLSEAKKRGIKPIAKILGHTSFSQEPAWFTTAPIKSIEMLIQKLNLKIESIDLFEINEAFACVTMAAMQDLKIPHEKVNVHGGACALGHPIGASGARIITTLLGALKQQKKSLGIASLCIGGGEATAIALEML
jgi:acetyl-CoA C-acetyltransferase